MPKCRGDSYEFAIFLLFLHVLSDKEEFRRTD
jgi:hypothetical protein